MSFEAPLGLSTSNHLYAIKVNMNSIVQFYFISPFNPVWGERRFFMLTSLFCDCFANNFICNRLSNRLSALILPRQR